MLRARASTWPRRSSSTMRPTCPFGDRGTGITFKPATAFAHSSNEPVQPLGTGITLDSPLANDHAIDAVVRDAAVTTAGYQGTPAPNQWFGGPVLSSPTPSPSATAPSPLNAGNMVLRDAAGLVVDSLNYGGVVDPWAAEGYQAVSGAAQSGCSRPAPGPVSGFGPFASCRAAVNTSAGRFPDGTDTDSNCTDFLMQPATTLPTVRLPAQPTSKSRAWQTLSAGQTITVEHGREPGDRRHCSRWHVWRHHLGRRHHCGRNRYPCRQPDGL